MGLSVMVVILSVTAYVGSKSVVDEALTNEDSRNFVALTMEEVFESRPSQASCREPQPRNPVVILPTRGRGHRPWLAGHDCLDLYDGAGYIGQHAATRRCDDDVVLNADATDGAQFLEARSADELSHLWVCQRLLQDVIREVEARLHPC